MVALEREQFMGKLFDQRRQQFTWQDWFQTLLLIYFAYYIYCTFLPAFVDNEIWKYSGHIQEHDKNISLKCTQFLSHFNALYDSKKSLQL